LFLINNKKPQSPISPLCRQKKLEVAMEEEGLADEEVILPE